MKVYCLTQSILEMYIHLDSEIVLLGGNPQQILACMHKKSYFTDILSVVAKKGGEDNINVQLLENIKQIMYHLY